MQSDLNTESSKYIDFVKIEEQIEEMILKMDIICLQRINRLVSYKKKYHKLRSNLQQ